MSDLAVVIQFLRGSLTEYERRDKESAGYIMSPDGWGEAYSAAAVIRRALALAEPDKWCPSHYYDGIGTNTIGEARLTCQICGTSFLGTFDDEGYRQ